MKVKISFAELPEFDMLFYNEIGKNLKNVPKLTEIINLALREGITRFLLEPNAIEIDIGAMISNTPKAEQRTVTPPEAIEVDSTRGVGSTLIKRKRKKVE